MQSAGFVRLCRVVRAAGIYADIRVCLQPSRIVYAQFRGSSASVFSGEVVGEDVDKRVFAVVHIS